MTNLKDLDQITKLSNRRNDLMVRLSYFREIEDGKVTPSTIFVGAGQSRIILAEMGIKCEPAQLLMMLAEQFTKKQIAEVDGALANLGVYPDPPDESG